MIAPLWPIEDREHSYHFDGAVEYQDLGVRRLLRCDVFHSSWRFAQLVCPCYKQRKDLSVYV
jgi:hypothetical protein